MGLSQEIRQRLINSFKTEQAEHVQRITEGLLALENRPQEPERQTLLDDIFREAHSLKGSAKAVGLVTIGALGHGLESLLLSAKDGRLDFSPELFDLLYQTLDAVQFIMQQVETGDAAPPARILALLAQLEESVEELESSGKETAAAGDETEPLLSPPPHQLTPSGSLVTDLESHGAQNDETIRVSVRKLDTLMAQFSDLLAAKIRTEKRLGEIRQLQQIASSWNKEWRALQGSYNRLIRRDDFGYDKDLAALVDFTHRNQKYLRQFNAEVSQLSHEFANDNMHLNLIADEFQDQIKRMRMLPLSTITLTFGRMVRDLARHQGKRIRLTITGSETELDKRVLEQVKAPFIHLLRNSVDHGIEEPESRQAAGKPEDGHISLIASQQGNNVVIKMEDDGRGLDLEAIRGAAVHKGLLTEEEARQLTDAEATSLIFRSGLSTSKIITDISGRGVGMDVVRQNIEELQGSIHVCSHKGLGTTFTIHLPLTLVSSRGLLVRSGGQTFALPLTTIERMLQVDPDNISTVQGREVITYNDRPIPLAWLDQLLGLPTAASASNTTLTVVVTAVADKQLGLVVSDLEGEQEIVIKTLGRQLAKVQGIAGATVMGSGEVLLVLHAADLMKMAAFAHRSPVQEGTIPEHREIAPRTVLVVDDSITTRTLEKNILETAGYEVKLATDGEEALGIMMSEGPPNLIVSDINMPHLDGFEMTDRIKSDKRYQGIPIILVTSLDTPADKARGIEVGADAYIVKSSFDQSNLLETVEELIL
jgi:two-component system chemotaxis sensor kinase CheA